MKELSFIPIENRMIVKEKSPETKTEAGLFIPEAFQANTDIKKGVVIVTGDKVSVCKLGDEVWFLKHVGTPIEIEREKYLIMRDKEIFGIKKESI